MNAQERHAMRLYARTRQHARQVEAARQWTADLLARCQRPYVSWSGGKDSSVVLHMARSIAPDTPAQFGHEEWLLPETQALLDAMPNVIQTALPDGHAEWFDAWAGGPGSVPEGVQYVDPARYNEYDYARRMLGYDGCLLGLRADESATRRWHLRVHGVLTYCDRHGVWECNPIAWWSVRDVWAYIVAHEVPYNAAYDKLSALGVPLERQRIGPLAVERVLGYGQLAILKRGWPELYNRFAAAHPEARAYV